MIKISNYDDYEVLDYGYADNKEHYEEIKKDMAKAYSKDYSDVRCYRTKTDTKGLIAYEVIGLPKN